jgi:cyclohexa-1,5-dienecarbonyl-CoA hydratase
MSDAPLKVWLDRGGTLLRLRLSRPKANIIDAPMITALRAALGAYRASAGLRGMLLDAEGPHFSFGASVEEHLPDQCAGMLAALHDLISEMFEWPAPILVAVQGQCLGGGLELACAGSLIFAASDAKLGQPEIKLGVFAPAASCLLPARIGQAAAEDLLLSGRSIDAQEALALGLATSTADDAQAAALGWFDRHLADKSASSLALALTAARAARATELRHRLREVEALYLDRLMKTRDANEGLKAFLAKRAPKWEHA